MTKRQKSIQFTKMENEQAETQFKPETVFSVVSRLFDGLLITEDEKLKMVVLQPTEMKAAIYDLMSEKDPKVAAKIFLVIRSVKDKCEADERHEHNQRQNPMQINTVIRNLFEFLGVEDLKTCRAVCQKWNMETEVLLLKNATITFGPWKCGNGFRKLEDFQKIFNQYSSPARNLTFTSFRFRSDWGRGRWNVSDITNFIDQQKNNIQDFQLCDIELLDAENFDWEKGYDINDWFDNFSVPRLTILCCDVAGTPLAFSLNILASVTHVTLRKCRLTIGDEKPITPTTINLDDVKFWRDGNLLEEYCVNDSIDFSKAKYIRISFIHGEYGFTRPILDLSKCHSANYMSLDAVGVINWKDCNSKHVNTLCLDCIPFLERTKMEIKELHFRNGPIDLFVLPLSIEKIYFGTSVVELIIISSQPISLPKLKILKLQQFENFRNLILFSNCSNLRNIEIEGAKDKDVLLDADWLPKSVIRMKLEGFEKIKYSNKLRLEKLVLENYSLANTAKIMFGIIPNILVLQWKREFETIASVLLFLQKFKDLVLFIGPFIWNDTINDFEMSFILAHVDKMAEYYVFENNQGRSIQRKEFENMKFLDKN